MSLNLLPSQAKFRAFKTLWKKRINAGLTGVIGVWVISAFLVLGLNIITRIKIKQEQRLYDKTYDLYKDKTDDLITTKQLKYQAKLMSKVLAERREYGLSISNVKKMFGEGYSVDNFVVKNFNSFGVIISTMDNKKVDELEKKLKNLTTNNIEGIAGAQLQSVSMTSGIWTFSLEVTTK